MVYDSASVDIRTSNFRGNIMPSSLRKRVDRTPLKLLQSIKTSESPYPLTKSDFAEEGKLQNVQFFLHITVYSYLTLILLTWRIWWAPNNASRWQMGFNSAFNGL